MQDTPIDAIATILRAVQEAAPAGVRAKRAYLRAIIIGLQSELDRLEALDDSTVDAVETLIYG